jgi:signal transduction histidine kinase/DNA-binding response OmpR family regulator
MALPLLRMEIRHEYDVVLVRQRARQIAAALKFDSQDQTRIATALSEVARNAFQYAGGGLVEFQIETPPAAALSVTVSDKGRGIENLREILDGKYVSRTGMGLGMIGARRLMDVFKVESTSRGTKVVLGKDLPPRFSGLSKRGLDDLLAQIESQGPQNAYEELQRQNQELLRALDELRTRQLELAQLNRELDETNRGVVALYAELDDRADFLQRASELKSHFLSNMSHEFRTPLNSMMALSQILLDRMDGELTDEQDKQVRFIKNSAQDLIDLVNDLLDLAKVEAGKVTIRPARFEVKTMFAALRGMLRPLLAQNSSVRLVFDDPDEEIEIYSDEGKLSQILRNLISNALKFTERGEVRIFVSRDQDQTIAFQVSDTGIGIAAEDQERIFQEWTQVEGKLQKVAKGTGLGLPLSRKLAQLLGGDVSVNSEVGVGSVFTVSIPMQFRGATEVEQVPDSKPELDATKLPVLVVEDNREALFIYETYLKDSNFQVVPASTVREARAAVRRMRPYAILLDVLLQGEHSWDFLQDLKADPATRDIPVYVLTVVDNREKALALGANAFHSKPIDRAWLMKQLEASFPSHQILVVDDDATSRYLLKVVLSQANYEVAEAGGGIEGLRMARELRPALIVLDLVMDDLSGFEVLEQLSADPATRSIPVVIHTSKDLDKAEQARLSAAIDIVPKTVMSSRESALVSFSEAFRKAGLTLLPTHDQVVAAE